MKQDIVFTSHWMTKNGSQQPYAPVPNIENDVPTTPVVEPISSHRVSPLGCLI